MGSVGRAGKVREGVVSWSSACMAAFVALAGTFGCVVEEVVEVVVAVVAELLKSVP